MEIVTLVIKDLVWGSKKYIEIVSLLEKENWEVKTQKPKKERDESKV